MIAIAHASYSNMKIEILGWKICFSLRNGGFINGKKTLYDDWSGWR